MGIFAIKNPIAAEKLEQDFYWARAAKRAEEREAEEELRKQQAEDPEHWVDYEPIII